MSLQLSVSLGVIWSNLIHEVMTRARVSRDSKYAPVLHRITLRLLTVIGIKSGRA